jgi:hypothetical protein
MGNGANESRVKVKKSNSNLISGRDSNVGGDYVVGDKHIQQEPDKHPYIEISLGQRSSSQGEYTIDFHLRNAGDRSCILQNFTLADEEIKISKRSITPIDEPYRIRHNITNFKVRQQKLDNPLVKVTYKDLNSRLYATTATIVQGLMAVGTYNIEEVDNNEFHILSGNEK